MVNIHIGCGNTIGHSWQNFDSSPILILKKIKFFFLKNETNLNKIKFGNIVKQKLCAENTADNIYFSHVLEHMNFSDAKKSLKNIYKMMKNNGSLRIVVPSLEKRIDKYLVNKDANEFIKSLHFFDTNTNNSFFMKIKFFLGNSRHRWMYDINSLKNALEEIGFKNIRPCKFGDSGIKVFEEVERLDRFLDDGYDALAFHCIK